MAATQQLLKAMQRLHGWWREAIVAGLSLAVFAWTSSQPPLAQDQTYHQFADQRWIFGVPHFWNVFSNVPFAVIGILGCCWLMSASRTVPAFQDRRERFAYLVFFGGEIVTCFGSAYYHAAPSNATLFWDRLPFSLMLTSFFTIVVTEFVNSRFGCRMLGPMVATGLVSVLYWAHSESLGNGDLRLYFLVQFYPMLAMVVILLLFRSRYTHGEAVWLMLALYGIAKITEFYDRGIFEWTGSVSGHTVKHLVAAVASSIPLYCLQRRTHRVHAWHSQSENTGVRARASARSVAAIAAGCVVGLVGTTLAAFVVIGLLTIAGTYHQSVFMTGFLIETTLYGGSGFAAALIARRRELVHAAPIALPGVLTGALLYHPPLVIPVYPSWYNSLSYIVMPASAIVGAYVGHRWNLARPPQDRRQVSANSFASRLTYAAIAIWGVGETMDSIPRLTEIIGMTFMVYSGAVWFLAGMIALASSMMLLFRGPNVHRGRVVIWYGTLALVAVTGSPSQRLAGEAFSAVAGVTWLIRTIWGRA